MRLLADEHIPLLSIRLLRDAGHDVASIAEIAPSDRDGDVLARARTEDRILLTFDSDFGVLLFVDRQPPPLGVVYFRYAQRSPTDVADLLTNLLDRSGFALAGRYTTVRRDRVRQRPLPP